MKRLEVYPDLVDALNEGGFMLFSGQPTLLSLADQTDPAAWHTEQENTDPWEWKRLLITRHDGVYAKVRGAQNMLISHEWHPLFIAAFHEGDVGGRYERGEMDRTVHALYELFDGQPVWNRHELSQTTGFSKAVLERALGTLQHEMTVTASDEVQRVSDRFSPIGWRSMEYTRTEIWAPDSWQKAQSIDRCEARSRILERALAITPNADEKAVRRFLKV